MREFKSINLSGPTTLLYHNLRHNLFTKHLTHVFLFATAMWLTTALFVSSLLAVLNGREQNKFAADNIDAGKDLAKEVETLRQIVGALSRQVMLQQMSAEERIRSDGDSGVKQVRHNHEGTKIYHSETHSSPDRILSIHQHSNNIRTVGMGEFTGVLNGVEFRTRHNDYRLFMPNRTSGDYHAVETIPFPDVPPEVSSKATVDEQIVEMRQWFKAWKDQDYSARDYRKYFKPVLCYVEGAWTTATKDIDEPFESDRHFVDASSWFDLQEKIRFTSYTGRKDNLENFSWLPTTIMDLINGTIPVFAQWNYRILCHPLKRDIPLNRFRVADELQPRMASKRTLWEHAKTRAARFQLNPYDTDTWKEGRTRWGLLDELMSEIPGKDNYQGKLIDEAFDIPAYPLAPGKTGKLNAAYYHRWFKVMEKGAMGSSTRHRGYSDENLFVAMTTQPKVAGMGLKTCKRVKGVKKKVCKTVKQKVSYALPLEIIWMTPLNKWNPFDLEYKGDERLPWGKTVFAGGRNGGKKYATAYNGTNSKKYYLVPSAFFSGGEVSTDAADTTKNSVGVLDKKGQVRITRASGTRVFFPLIPEVGIMRQRYPIMPIHGQGSSVWKELEAAKDILLQSKTNGYMCREPLGGSGPLPTEPSKKPLRLETQDARRTPPGAHRHQVTLTADDVELARDGATLVKTTETAAGHEHTITISFVKKKNVWAIDKCDERYDTRKTRCYDQHGRFLEIILEE